MAGPDNYSRYAGEFMTKPYYFEFVPKSGINVLMICQKWDGDIDDFVRKNDIDAICLNYAKGWEGEKLDFISRHNQLKYLKILDWEIKDISGINALNNLNELSISTYCKTKIDFHNFPKLKRCFFEWRKGSDSLFDCEQLDYLYLLNYTGKHFKPISKLANLSELNLVDPRFDTLEGIEQLTKLKILQIVSRRLVTIEQIAKLEQLESLGIFDSKKIEKIDPISKLVNLKTLSLENMGEIESLKPLLACKSMEELYFSESTKVRDGQIRFLKQMTRLKTVRFENRRHYDAKYLDFRGRTARTGSRLE